jgi:ankyrin repeat protein
MSTSKAVSRSRDTFDHCRRRAKELLKRARAGESEALTRFAEHHPGGSARVEAINLALHDAPWVVAREQGFTSWSRLKAFHGALAAAPEQTPADRLQALVRGKDLETLLAHLEGDASALHLRLSPPGTTALHLAVQVGWREGIDALLDAGADVDARSHELGMTPLRIAVGHGWTDLALHLLERGADPEVGNDGNKTTVQAAVYAKDLVVLRALLARGARADVFVAVALGDEALLRRLHAEEPSVLRARMCSYEKVTLSPLHLAAVQDAAAMIHLLLDLGAERDATDEQGRSAIDLALHTAQRIAYDTLFARGARADATLLSLVGSVERSLSIKRLHQALVSGDLDHVLLELDLDRSLLDQRFRDVWGTGGTFGAAPLHWAAMFGHQAIARALIERGADLTLTDLTYHGTPLGWAREYQRHEMVAFLKAYGSPA